MGALRTPREKWIEEGLRALAAGGVDAVRVEMLAKALGVTKGGFYGYFSDRNALLEEMLDTWERASIDEVLAQVEQAGGDPRDRIRLAGQLTFSGDRMQVELAIRDWARRDEKVTERLRRVDNQRIQLAREMIGTFCDDPAEVEARSLLAFCLAIGHHFLAAEHPGRSHLEVRSLASDFILGVRAPSHPPGAPD